VRAQEVSSQVQRKQNVARMLERVLAEQRRSQGERAARAAAAALAAMACAPTQVTPRRMSGHQLRHTVSETNSKGKHGSQLLYARTTPRSPRKLNQCFSVTSD
jgi:hypothetical protein